jgi:hypothetical protein
MTKYKNDPTEEHDYEPSASDNFWLSQDDQSNEAKEYVNELEKKIREAKICLKLLYSVAKQTELTFFKNNINQIINNLK